MLSRLHVRSLGPARVALASKFNSPSFIYILYLFYHNNFLLIMATRIHHVIYTTHACSCQPLSAPFSYGGFWVNTSPRHLSNSNFYLFSFWANKLSLFLWAPFHCTWFIPKLYIFCFMYHTYKTQKGHQQIIHMCQIQRIYLLISHLPVHARSYQFLLLLPSPCYIYPAPVIQRRFSGHKSKPHCLFHQQGSLTAVIIISSSTSDGLKFHRLNVLSAAMPSL